MSINRALIIEDDRSCRYLVEHVLDELGIAPFCTSSAESALQLISENSRFDLLIVDYQLPQMNGLDLIRALRSKESYRSVPILMISGMIRLGEIRTILDNGVDYFLPKPLKVVDLTFYVTSTLGLTRGSDPDLRA